MAGIQGMGNPSQLKKPGDFDINNVAQVPDIASMDIPAPQPQRPAQQQAAMDPMQDPEVLAILGMDQSAPDPMQDPDVLAILNGEAPAQSSASNMVSETPPTLGETIQAIPSRFRASFAKTKKEKRFVLEDTFGADNVRDAGDGDFEVRKNGEWKRFDPSGANWDLINDVVDFSRDALEEVGTTVGTIVGGGSALATGPAAPATLFPAVAAGRAVGGATGVALGDAYQAWLGIPRDPNRSRTQELAIGATLGAVAGEVGDWLGRKIAEKGARKSAEAVMSTEKVTRKAAEDVLEASQKLQDAGLISNVEGFNVAILPSQAALKNPDAKAIAKQLADDPRMKGFVLKQYEMVSDAFDKIANSVSNYTGKTKAGLGEKFQTTVEGLDDAQGKLIGDYRAMIPAALKSKPLKIDNTGRVLDEIANELGFITEKSGGAIPVITGFKKPSIKYVVDEVGLEPREAKILIDKVYDLKQRITLSGDNLPAKEMDILYNRYNGLSKNLWKKQGGDTLYRDYITRLRGGLADDYTEGIGDLVDENTKKSYIAAKERFGEIRDSMKTIKGVLAKNQISANALASQMFSKNNLDKMTAAKTLLKDDPALWQDLVGQKLLDVVAKNTDAEKTNWGAVSKSLQEEIGDEGLSVMFGSQKETLDNFIKLSRAIEAGTPDLQATPEKVGAVKNLILSFVSTFAQANTAVEMFGNMDREKKIATFLSKEGIEIFTKGVPPMEAGKMRKFLNAYMDYQTRLAEKTMPLTIRRVGADAAPREEEE